MKKRSGSDGMRVWTTLSRGPADTGTRKRADSARPDLMLDIQDGGVDSANTNTFKAMELSPMAYANSRAKMGVRR